MNATDHPAALDRPTGAGKARTLLFNPFYYIAGGPALGLGLAILLVTALIAHFAHAQFDGVLDCHFTLASQPLWYGIVVSAIDWLALALILLLPAKMLSKSRGVRTVDVVGTQALARAPWLLFVVLTLVPSVQRVSARLEEAVTQGLMPDFLTRLDFDVVVFVAVAFLFLPLMVWIVALMYRAYAFSSNLRGARAVISFILGLVVAEVLSKLAIAALSSCLAAPGVAAGTTVPAADAVSTAATSVAEKMIDTLAGGDAVAASQDFDATMRKALPPEKLKKTWDDLTAANGEFQAREAEKIQKMGKYEVVLINCRFAKQTVALQVTVSPDGQVAGYYLRPKF